MDQIVGRFGDDKDAETDEEENIEERIGLRQAMEALETLKLY